MSVKGLMQVFEEKSQEEVPLRGGGEGTIEEVSKYGKRHQRVEGTEHQLN